MMIRTIGLLARIAFWCGLIFAYVMAIIPDGEPGLELHNDKANHMLAFFVLAALARIGWRRNPVWLTGVLLFAFGIFIELSQAMPLIHRDPEVADVVADTIATVVGLAAGSIVLVLLRRKDQGGAPY